MKKIELKIIPSVDTSDIIFFIQQNSNLNWNMACDVFTGELNYIQFKLPEQIKIEVDFHVSKVIVNKLEYDGWIKKFTEVHEITEDYYILFTD